DAAVAATEVQVEVHPPAHEECGRTDNRRDDGGGRELGVVHRASIIPVMKLWMAQWYAYVPGASTVIVFFAPPSRSPVSNLPSSVVSVCTVPSSLVTVTALPAFTTIGLGENWKFLIDTASPAMPFPPPPPDTATVPSSVTVSVTS